MTPVVTLPSGVCAGCIKDCPTKPEDTIRDDDYPLTYRLCATCCPHEFCNHKCRKNHPGFRALDDPSVKECTCGRDFLLDIEVCEKPGGLDSGPRNYRQVCVSASTTFSELHHAIAVLFCFNTPQEYLFCDPSWNRIFHNTNIPDDANIRGVTPVLIGGEIKRYYQKQIEAGKIKPQNGADDQSQYDSNTRIAAWIGKYEERSYFWYVGFCKALYNCFLITLKKRLESRVHFPWMSSASEHPVGLLRTTHYGDLNGERSWQEPFGHFGRLTVQEFMARHDIPGPEASARDRDAINCWLAFPNSKTYHTTP